MPDKTNATLDKEKEEYYKEKNKWLTIAEKIVLPVLGFLCVWIFNSVNTLTADITKLNDKNFNERIVVLEKEGIKRSEIDAMWKTIKSYDDRINANKVQAQVNALINKRFTSLVMNVIEPPEKVSWIKKALGQENDSKLSEKPVELIHDRFEESLEKDYQQYKNEKIRDFHEQRKK